MTVREQVKRYIAAHPEYSQRKVAQAIDVNPSWLNRLLGQTDDPSVPVTLIRAIEYLGLELVVKEKGK